VDAWVAKSLVPAFLLDGFYRCVQLRLDQKDVDLAKLWSQDWKGDMLGAPNVSSWKPSRMAVLEELFLLWVSTSIELNLLSLPNESAGEI